jgi:hypothetical protein
MRPSGVPVGSAGGRRVAPLIEHRPAMSGPGERNAGSVAGAVPGIARSVPAGAARGAVQRMCAECEDEEKKQVQAKTVSSREPPPAGVPGEASPVLDVVGHGGGQPLAPPVRAAMEAALGADFSAVRVHTDAKAARSAAAVSAQAYTVGNEVVFGHGAFAPGTSEGRRTLAHELAHVLQQRAGPVSGTDTGTGVRVSDPSDSFEQDAEATASRVLPRPRPAASHGRPADGMPPNQQGLSAADCPGAPLPQPAHKALSRMIDDGLSGVISLLGPFLPHRPVAAGTASLQRDDASHADDVTSDSDAVPGQSSEAMCGGMDFEVDWSSVPDASKVDQENGVVQTVQVQRQELTLGPSPGGPCPVPASWNAYAPVDKSPNGDNSIAAMSAVSFLFDTSSRTFSIVQRSEGMWVVKMARDHDDGTLLRHEQYHFKLACVLVAKANQALTPGVSPSKSMSILLSSANCQNDSYDWDTKRGLDQPMQSAWERDIDAAVPAYPFSC